MGMWGMAALSRHMLGRRAPAMLIAATLVCRAQGCAVLCRAELRRAMPRLCSVALWIGSSLAFES
eukprot:2920427-Pyramimonas_sp.AAC.1